MPQPSSNLRCHTPIVLFSLLVSGVGCTVPKYTYFFDHQHYIVRPPSPPIESSQIQSADIPKQTIQTEPWTIAATITASITAPSFAEANQVVSSSRRHTPETLGRRKSEPPVEYFELPQTTQRNPRKNWAAILGFASIIAGVVTIGTFEVLAGLLILGGATLCIVGLKSQKRGWAIAGLYTLAAVGLAILFFLIDPGKTI